MQKIKILSITLCALLILLLALNIQNDRKNTSRMEAAEAAAYTLQQERLELQKSLTQLEKEYQIKINGKATLTFVFTELSENVYTDIYPKMQEYGYYGILALSSENFPDSSGCMTTAQFKELLENGWTVCLLWNGGQELSSWLPKMQKLLADEGIEMPQLVYFERETYQMEYDEFLLDYGITAVIHHQEENLPLLNTQTEEGIWHIGAWGWNQVNAKNTLNEAMEDGAGLVFKLGNDYYYNESQFERMLATVFEYESEANLFVTDIATAYDYRGWAESERDNVQNELTTKLEEIRLKITQIDEEIKAIYKEYGIGT